MTVSGTDFLGSGRKAVRAWRECPQKLTPPAKLAGTPISDDETVAKMGHPDLLWLRPGPLAHPPKTGTRHQLGELHIITHSDEHPTANLFKLSPNVIWVSVDLTPALPHTVTALLVQSSIKLLMTK